MAGLKRVRTEKLNGVAAGRLADAPESCRGILTRTYQGKASPGQAIKAFCLQCTGYVRKDVTDCSALGCPLHPYRPYQAGQDDDE